MEENGAVPAPEKTEILIFHKRENIKSATLGVSKNERYSFLKYKGLSDIIFQTSILFIL